MRQSAGDHGTLGYFRSLLNRNTVTTDPKKAVDANLEFFDTVFKGHILACACRILGVTKLNSKLQLPPGIYHASKQQQLAYIRSLATQVVEECTLIDTTNDVAETDDQVYNYARVLCHYGALVLEFRDACAEGDGQRVFRCWRLMLPHFKAAGRTKYSLEALRLQFQVKAILSPQLAHQVLWDRFVNTRGGLGRNIQNDLYNEHIVKLVKNIITCMGVNLTEEALQRAARSVSMLSAVCKQFDTESGVPVTTSEHKTRSTVTDIGKVVTAVLTNDLLQTTTGRSHRTFRRMRLNPLWNWDRKKTTDWIEKKKKDFMRFRGAVREDEADECSDAETGDEDHL